MPRLFLELRPAAAAPAATSLDAQEEVLLMDYGRFRPPYSSKAVVALLRRPHWSERFFELTAEYLRYYSPWV